MFRKANHDSTKFQGLFFSGQNTVKHLLHCSCGNKISQFIKKALFAHFNFGLFILSDVCHTINIY